VPLSRNLGTLTSQNPLGLFRPVMGLIYLYLLPYIVRVIKVRRVKIREKGAMRNP